jgi:hypothetical protein
MTGRQRNLTNSWVVGGTGSRRGWPTGYKIDEIHPDCLQQILENRDNVIKDSEVLRLWLDS